MVLLGKGVGETVHALHERQGELVEALTDPGEGHVSSTAIEEWQPELLFQRTHLERYRRLARHELLGRPRDAAELSRLAECTELLEPISLRVARYSVLDIGSRGAFRARRRSRYPSRRSLPWGFGFAGMHGRGSVTASKDNSMPAASAAGAKSRSLSFVTAPIDASSGLSS